MYPGHHSHRAELYSSGTQGMALARGYDNYDTPTMPTPTNPYMHLDILKNASKQALLASENAVFFELFEENISLKAELKAAKSSLLLQQKETLRAHAESVPTFADSSSTRRPDTIQIPPSPPSCLQEDYPDAAFWTRSEWNSCAQKLAANGVYSKKLDFLTDEEGNGISEARLAAMSKEAKHAWATLHYYRLSPENWSAKMSIAGEFFSNYMRTKFVEFRWCENDWKVEAFATVRYPEWKPTRNSGTLLRQNPSIKPALPKIKQEKLPSTSRQTQQPVPQKRRRVEPKDIIELKSDSDSDSERPQQKKKRVEQSKGATSSTPAVPHSSVPISSAATASTIATTVVVTDLPALPTQNTVSPSTPPATSSASSPTPACSLSTSQPPVPQTSATEPLIPTTTLVPPAPASVVSAPTVASPAVAPAPPPQAPIASPVHPLTAALTSGNAVEALEPPHVPALSSLGALEDPKANSRTRHSRRTGANILSNLVIPSPNADLVAPIKDSNIPSVSTSKTTADQGAKAEKLVKDNGTTSARNLYVIDYIKAHGPTTAIAFKEIWDKIDAETAKKYKALSAAAKKGT